MELVNDQETKVAAGTYAFDVSGAMELQTDISGVFKTLKDGTFAGADDDIIELPSCNIKIINAGAAVFNFNLITSV